MLITKSIQIKPDVITTSRLILRSAIQGDGEKLFDRYCGDAACSRFLMRGRHISVAQTENFLDRWCGKAWEDGGSFAWVIAEKMRNEPIGIFTVIIRDHHAEFHFGISKSHWGKGLVIEAGLAVIAWLETTNSLCDINTICDPENINSIRVLEGLGFVKNDALRHFAVMPELGLAPRACYIYHRPYLQSR